jgi:hypothetical protein
MHIFDGKQGGMLYEKWHNSGKEPGHSFDRSHEWQVVATMFGFVLFVQPSYETKTLKIEEF